jgi:hypothetical protein
MERCTRRTVRVAWRKYIDASVAGITDYFEQTIRRTGWKIEERSGDESTQPSWAGVEKINS